MLIVTLTEVIVKYIPGLGFIEIRRTVQVIETVKYVRKLTPYKQ